MERRDLRRKLQCSHFSERSLEELIQKVFKVFVWMIFHLWYSNCRRLGLSEHLSVQHRLGGWSNDWRACQKKCWSVCTTNLSHLISFLQIFKNSLTTGPFLIFNQSARKMKILRIPKEHGMGSIFHFRYRQHDTRTHFPPGILIPMIWYHLWLMLWRIWLRKKNSTENELPSNWTRNEKQTCAYPRKTINVAVTGLVLKQKTILPKTAQHSFYKCRKINSDL